MNAFTRNLSWMFPGFFTRAKHNPYRDFGYPEVLDFNQFYSAYTRNGFARAAVDRTIAKSWQSNPAVWETDDPNETPFEAELRQRFDDIRLWQMFAEADRRSMVGGYSGLILRFADGLPFNQPVARVNGLEGLVEVIPAWRGQLEVATWSTDPVAEDYGWPRMYQFNEQAVQISGQTKGAQRSVSIHPDRVLIMSKDGTVNCSSALEPGFNDLIDLEKIKGAGGEGFWKNAKSAPVLSIDKEAKLADMAKAMGVGTQDVVESMNQQVEYWQQGFDQLLMLQGMEAKTLGVTLPQPGEFMDASLMSFSSSMMIPQKILVGSQTGERASTEDAHEWAVTNNGRRSNQLVPAIRTFLHRLERVGVLPPKDWVVDWDDLTEDSLEQKLKQADQMAAINQKLGDEPAFTVDEIREQVGKDPIEPVDLGDDE